MRILHIAHYDVYPRSAETFVNNTRNGLEQCLDSLIKNMSDIEHFVLFFNHYENTIFIEKIDEYGVATVYSYYGPTTYKDNELREIFKEILQDFAPNLVHIHYLKDYTKKLPKILNELGFSSIITTMHDESFLGENYGMNQKYTYDQSVNEFITYNKHIVFLHEVSQQRFKRFYKEQLLGKDSIIPNGIDLENVNNNFTQSESLKVLFLGSFNYEKGIDIIKEMANENKEKIEFILLGTATEKIEGLIDKGLYTRNNLVQKVQQINPDIIAIPSIVEEVYPYTALEATAMGYPIICFSVGSLQKIENEERGFVVKEKTAPAFYQKLQGISKMKDNHMEWEKLVQKISEKQLVSTNQMVNKYRSIYEEYNNKSITPLKIEHIFQKNLEYQKLKEQLLFEKDCQYKKEQYLRNKESSLAFELSKKNEILESELKIIPNKVRKFFKKIKSN